MTKVVWRGPRKSGSKYIIQSAFDSFPGIVYSNPEYLPTFTLSPEDHDGLISLEKRFLATYTDPTEFTFVQDCFDGDINHWEAFKESTTFRPYYLKWKKTAETKLTSIAMQKIVESAMDDNNRNSFQALKFLVDRGSKITTEKKAGRPRKEKLEEPVDSQALLDDIARLKA